MRALGPSILPPALARRAIAWAMGGWLVVGALGSWLGGAGGNVVGFLAPYARAGPPDGPPRGVARPGLAALAPLAWVAWRAWTR